MAFRGTSKFPGFFMIEVVHKHKDFIFKDFKIQISQMLIFFFFNVKISGAFYFYFLTCKNMFF